MPKGGARARSGPPPDPGALRRDREVGDWTHLPESGRVGETPAWPLAGQTDREAELWAQQWTRPQAIVWERNGQQLEVALFVRACIRAESSETALAADRTLVRQMMDSLGLTVPGMRANRWKIVADDSAPARPAASRAATGSARARFKVVDGGGG